MELKITLIQDADRDIVIIIENTSLKKSIEITSIITAWRQTENQKKVSSSYHFCHCWLL